MILLIAHCILFLTSSLNTSGGRSRVSERKPDGLSGPGIEEEGGEGVQ